MAWVDEWLARLIPRRCVLCNEPGGEHAVCDGCRADLPWLAPLHAATVFGRVRAFAPLSYEYPVDRLVAAAKFRGKLGAARALGELLASAVPLADCWDLLMPVPLHHRRLVERGYNQALEIARPVAAHTGVALAAALCERTRPTAEQSGLPASRRRRNLQGAFRCGTCAGARVVILDDVITTGSTAVALERALRAAGAAEVIAWAVARTL